MKAFLYIGGCALAGALVSMLIYGALTAISPILGGAFVGYLLYKIVTY